MPKMYGWVREVVPESPADRAGLQPGDLIRTINGHLIRDLVDYRFYVADEELTIGFERQLNAHEVSITKSFDENLGVLFGEEPAPFIANAPINVSSALSKDCPNVSHPNRVWHMACVPRSTSRMMTIATRSCLEISSL